MSDRLCQNSLHLEFIPSVFTHTHAFTHTHTQMKKRNDQAKCDITKISHTLVPCELSQLMSFPIDEVKHVM